MFWENILPEIESEFFFNRNALKLNIFCVFLANPKTIALTIRASWII